MSHLENRLHPTDVLARHSHRNTGGTYVEEKNWESLSNVASWRFSWTAKATGWSELSRGRTKDFSVGCIINFASSSTLPFLRWPWLNSINCGALIWGCNMFLMRLWVKMIFLPIPLRSAELMFFFCWFFSILIYRSSVWSLIFFQTGPILV